jgi:hypothetical protein
MHRKRILLAKKGDVYTLSIGITETERNDPLVQRHLQNLELGLGMQFSDKKVIINFCDSSCMAKIN